jgi:hypothetical protein
MTYRLGVRGPLPSTKGSPRGERAWWEMSKATLEGKRIKAQSAMSGMDWFSARPDGFGRPDVRLPFNTDDGVMVLLHYTGLVETNTAFTKAAEEGGETRFEDHYMRMALNFETGAPAYAWLNQRLFIAEGRPSGKRQLEYCVYRVT